MKLKNLLLASVAVLGLVAFTAAQANAAAIGINIEVFKNGVSQGTAFGGASTSTSTPLIVTASNGDTLRFVVQISNGSQTFNGFTTAITAADANNSAGGSAELRYVAGSGVMLEGTGFATFLGNPNNSLNDATPATGNGSNNGTGGSATPNMYRVDYIVQAVVTDATRDWNAALTVLSTPDFATIDPAIDTASVRVDAGQAEPIPEPASLLLLGSGLAAVAGMVRRRR